MTRAVIFDMDGVLIDSEPLHLVATNQVLAAHGAHLSPSENQAYLGWTEDAFWRDIVGRFHLAGSPDQYGVARRQIYLSLLSGSLPMADGIAPFLQRLKSLGLLLAVASSSDADVVRHVVTRGGLAAYFDVIVAGDEVTRSKPDPEIFLLAARRLAVTPEHCLVFEDSPHGIEAALRAGVRCVRVMTETTRDLACPEAHYAIDDFTGLDLVPLLGAGGT